MKKWFWLIDQTLLHLLYPVRCMVCGQVTESKEGICRECRKKLSYVSEPSCKKCGKSLGKEWIEYCYDCKKKTHRYTQGKAVWNYEGEIKQSLFALKFQNKRDYGRIMGEELARIYGDWIYAKGIEAIVAIPLHKKRRRQRGFNQSEVIAAALSKKLELPLEKGLLIRTKNTKAQKELPVEERKNNVKNAFQKGTGVVQYKKILIIDDIYTTGNTIDSAAGVLIDSGVLEVYFCCIAIGKGN